MILYEIVDLLRAYENFLSCLILGAIWLPVLLLPPIWFSQGRRWLGLGMIGAAALNITVYLVISLLSGAPAGWTGCLIPLPTSALVWFGN